MFLKKSRYINEIISPVKKLNLKELETACKKDFLTFLPTAKPNAIEYAEAMENISTLQKYDEAPASSPVTRTNDPETPGTPSVDKSGALSYRRNKSPTKDLSLNRPT